MAKSTNRPTYRKPSKDFPLFPHATARWAKKIKQRLHYFGPCKGDEDGQQALAEWLRVKDDLLAGRTPRPKGDGFTVADLCNRFLTAKQHLVSTGEIVRRTFDDYFATCERLVQVFGKNRLVIDLASDDFETLRSNISKTWGAVSLGNEINRTRVVFKFGCDAGLIDRPVRYGPGFKRPSKKVLRQQRYSKPARMLDANEVRACLEIASPQMKAMILLGANCGFGCKDCGMLPLSALDMDAGWVNFPRPKTGIPRRCKLWPETIGALRTAIEERPTPKDTADARLVFVTKYGTSWAKETRDIPITKEFRKILDKLKIHRLGLGFYALRHGFETIGGDTRDQVAVDHIMGHARDDMASHYRERIDDSRLAAVANHVRSWLFNRPDAVATPSSHRRNN